MHGNLACPPITLVRTFSAPFQLGTHSFEFIPVFSGGMPHRVVLHPGPEEDLFAWIISSQELHVLRVLKVCDSISN